MELWFTVDLLIAASLLVAVGLNLRTGIKVEGVVVMDKLAIFIT